MRTSGQNTDERKKDKTEKFSVSSKEPKVTPVFG
jgi:hypothetical protein